MEDEKHEVAELSQDEIEDMRQKSRVERAKHVRPRGNLRAQLTKTHTAFETFTAASPSPEHYEEMEFAKLSTLHMRVETVAEKIENCNKAISRTYDPLTDTDEEIQAEFTTCLEYDEMLMVMITFHDLAFKTLKQKREVEKLKATPATHATVSTPTPTSTVTPSSSHTFSYSGVKPPDVKMPDFDGDYLLWPSFIDRFMGMIDSNVRFSPVHKLDYLKGCLKGEPARLLQGLLSIDSNYQIALDILISVYQDEWPTIAKHLELMFNFKPLTTKSTKELRRLHECFSLNTSGLRNLGYPFDNYVMVFLFATKLDPETRELWEHNVVELPKDPTTGRQVVPSSSFILEFVKKRARTLEHTTNLKLGLTSGSPNKALRMTTTKAASTTLGRTDPRTEYSGQVDANFTGKNYTQKTSVNKPKDGNKKHFATPLAPKAPCQHCSEAHQIWKCEAFRDAPVAAKLTTVNKARICFNCLASGHASKACPSKYSCRVCQLRHHTYLHDSTTHRSAPLHQQQSA